MNPLDFLELLNEYRKFGVLGVFTLFFLTFRKSILNALNQFGEGFASFKKQKIITDNEVKKVIIEQYEKTVNKLENTQKELKEKIINLETINQELRITLKVQEERYNEMKLNHDKQMEKLSDKVSKLYDEMKTKDSKIIELQTKLGNN